MKMTLYTILPKNNYFDRTRSQELCVAHVQSKPVRFNAQFAVGITNIEGTITIVGAATYNQAAEMPVMCPHKRRGN